MVVLCLLVAPSSSQALSLLFQDGGADEAGEVRAGSPLGPLGLGMHDWDPAGLREEEFEEQAVYLVPDQPHQQCEAQGQAGQALPRAHASLPRNLVLKPSQALSDVSLLS